MLDKVLILSTSAGAGHLRAAQALEGAFARKRAAREVRHHDVLDHTSALFRNLYSKAYIEMVKRSPELLGWVYDKLDQPRPEGFDKIKLAFDKLNAGPFIKLLESYQPELIVCTHPLPAEIIAWLRSEGRIVARQVTVITDFDLHYPWLCDGCEHYFVAIDETRAHLEALQVPARAISVTGIPIDLAFTQKRDPKAMRRKHGLTSEDPVLLLTGGGFGIGQVVPVLDQVLRLKSPAQVVVVCGKNEALLQALEDRIATSTAPRHVKIKLLGFTREMDELMAAADLLVGKPGGLTSSEALARGLPLVIVSPIPGQEERNADHLLELGAAIRCNNHPVLAYKIDRLLADTRRLAALRTNARKAGKPFAALDIVDRLLDLRGYPIGRVQRR